jgi:hypothetical protein
MPQKKNLQKSLLLHHNYLRLPRTVAVARMGLLPSLLILMPVLLVLPVTALQTYQLISQGRCLTATVMAVVPTA